MIPGLKIGDGTAPAGFPAYRGCTFADGAKGVECTFNGCGHRGVGLKEPAMECVSIGGLCKCPCCRMLSGIPQLGCTYGGYDRTKATQP